MNEAKNTIQHHTHHTDPQQVKKKLANAHLLIEYLIRIGVKPQSVVDVGCGYGFFLAESKAIWGVEKYLGFDGDWVDTSKLMIPADHFRAVDLKQQLKCEEHYDLCVCLEVAEHLEPNYAGALIKQLTSLSGLVLFSAAFPGQGGKGHMNEQHIDYWCRLFSECEYHAVDILHDYVWNDSRLSLWFRNNIMLFASREILDYYRHFRRYVVFGSVIQRIHPQMFAQRKK